MMACRLMPAPSDTCCEVALIRRKVKCRQLFHAFCKPQCSALGGMSYNVSVPMLSDLMYIRATTLYAGLP